MVRVILQQNSISPMFSRILVILFTTLSLANISLAQKNIAFQSNLKYTAQLNDIWGYVDTSSNEYAIVGVFNGVSIVDVTDPINPLEKFFIKGPLSTWRDIKTWDQHAYVVHDNISGSDTSVGLMIIDLSGLPDSIDTIFWMGDTLNYRKAHNIYIDENGIAYLFGSNIKNGSVLFLDLTDPKNPVPKGNYTANYAHDGYVRGDTLYTAEIYAGLVTISDISDKAKPSILANFSTPHNTTHNCWLSNNGKYIYTTDEVRGGYIGAYDISDLGNIKESDRYRSNAGSDVIPHNVHVLNNYVVISYYKDGVIILDVTRPSNLVEVGSYDTAPTKEGGGFAGAWGAYPYLPSGNLLVSDMQEGLFVLAPNYQRGAYLEGNISDINGNPINNIKVELVGTGTFANTDLLGNYQLGIVDSGTYSIKITDDLCYSKIIPNIVLKKGQITQRNDSVQCCYLKGTVMDLQSNPLKDVTVSIQDAGFSVETDSLGEFIVCDIIPGLYDIHFSYPTCYSSTLQFNLRREQFDSSDIHLICQYDINNFGFFAGPTLFESSTILYYFLTTAPDADAAIALTDVSGRLIAEYPITSTKGSISIDDFHSSGIYFASLITHDNKKTIKLVKLKR